MDTLAFSIDPDGTQIIDQLFSFTGKRISLYTPFITPDRRYKNCKDLSLREQKVHRCIQTSFTLDDLCNPRKIQVLETEILNKKEYPFEQLELADIPEISIWGRKIIKDFGMSALYRTANLALNIFCFEKRIPFIMKFKNGNYCLGKSTQPIERLTWTAPLRRESDKINVINLSYYLSNSTILYSEEDLEYDIAEKALGLKKSAKEKTKILQFTQKEDIEEEKITNVVPINTTRGSVPYRRYGGRHFSTHR